MLLSEINAQFDLRFENLTTAGTIGLDDYEKSICLTYGQLELVKAYAEAEDLLHIDGTIDFNSMTPATSNNYEKAYEASPLNAIKILDRTLIDTVDNTYRIMGEVVPASTIREMINAPYKYPPKNVVYVLVGENAEIVFPPIGFQVGDYIRRYVKYPTPVILTQLSGADSIDGLQAPTDSILSDTGQNEMITVAVAFAIETYVGQPKQSTNQ
tara:strand:+ start:37722 stop:38357 length:636 start_codon:yes stop_codon:yes gene_type:complete